METVKGLLAQGLQEMGLTPPPGAVDKLCRYGELLLEQNQVMNLTAITEPLAVAQLHFLDSAAVLAYGKCGEWASEGAWNEARASAKPQGGLETSPSRSESDRAPWPIQSMTAPPPGGRHNSTWLTGKSLIDVGTGAGFPGMVLKILEPSLSLTLADSLGKRVRWLEEVCEALSLDGVRCLHVRAEELALEPGFRDSFDVTTSRAVAAFPLLCELCLPFVKVGGVFLAMKSVDSAAETAAGESAVKRLGGKRLEDVDYPIPGTDTLHRLVRVEKTAPTPKGLPRSWGKIKKAPL